MLTLGLPPPGTSVKQTDADGRGLFATTCFEEGDFVFLDHAIVHIRHHYSSDVLRTCLNCCAVLGDLEGVLDGVFRSFGKNTLSCFPALAGSAALTLRVADEVVPCEIPGCDVAFCSTSCQLEAAHFGHHRLTCLEMSPERRLIWDAFKAFAVKHNESGFMLAALLILQAVVEVKYKGRELAEVEAVFFGGGKQSKHWEDVSELFASDIQNPQDWAARRQEWIVRAFLMFRDSFASTLDARFSHLFEFQRFSRVVGMVDRYAKDMSFANPLGERIRNLAATDMHVEDAFRHLRPLVHKVWSRLCEQSQRKEVPNYPDLADLDAESEEDECEAVGNSAENAPSWDEFLPRNEGVGLFNITDTLNHSCSPNLTVTGDGGRTVAAKALRRIEDGEELTVSYIDESAPFASRQRELFHVWGFWCRCSKCSSHGGDDRALEGEGKVLSGSV